MSRLVLVAAILLALWAVITGGISVLRRLAARTGPALPHSGSKGAMMQKTSFIILVAVIFYVSLWGGA